MKNETEQTQGQTQDSLEAEVADNLVVFDAPLKTASGTEIKQIQLREPKAGELRGIKLIEVMQLDYGAFEELLPRISYPVLTKQQMASMSLHDLTAIMNKVAGFFEKKPSPKP